MVLTQQKRTLCCPRNSGDQRSTATFRESDLSGLGLTNVLFSRFSFNFQFPRTIRIRDGRRLVADRKRSELILWGIAGGAMALATAALFDHFGRFELARPTGFAMMVVAVVVKVCWRLRDRLWFWIVVIAIGALHVPLIMLIRWPTGWVPGAVAYPFVILDLIVYIAVIDLLEKLFGGETSTT
jgi:hypothetical protein